MNYIKNQKVILLAISLVLIVSSGILAAETTFVSQAGLEGQFDLEPVCGDKILIEYDAVAKAEAIDGVMAFIGSDVVVSHWRDLAIISRMVEGFFDARDGGTYSAENVLAFVPGETYGFRYIIDMNAKTYDLFITTPEKTEVQIAKDYAFRTDAPVPGEIGKLFMRSQHGDGNVTVTNLKITEIE